jgi:hypothetical protein
MSADRHLVAGRGIMAILRQILAARDGVRAFFSVQTDRSGLVFAHKKRVRKAPMTEQVST